VDDRHTYSKKYLESVLAVLMGGRAAEKLVLDQLTTGAGNDLEKATAMARKMVCKWGMSEAMGPLSIGDKHDEIFIGRDLGHFKDFSEQTARLVDGEIKRIVEDAQATAERVLSENLDLLNLITQALLDRETISGDDIKTIMRGEALPPDNGVGKNKTQAAAAYAEAAKAAQTSGETIAAAGQAPQAHAADDFSFDAQDQNHTHETPEKKDA